MFVVLFLKADEKLLEGTGFLLSSYYVLRTKLGVYIYIYIYVYIYIYIAVIIETIYKVYN